MSIKEKYAAIHKQGWLPIFVGDSLDSVALADVCVDAGCKAVEITCRRPSVLEEIRDVKKKYPGLLVLAGSTVDNDRIVLHLKKYNFGMAALKELAEAGADGFVARLPFMPETFEKYGKDFILIPGVETVKEAYESLLYGAHFVKFCGIAPGRAAEINSAATHGIFPLFVTGGVTEEKIPLYVRAGVSLLAAGWDVMLGDIYEKQQADFCHETALARLREYMGAFTRARREHLPCYDEIAGLGSDEYINSLKHYHLF